MGLPRQPGPTGCHSAPPHSPEQRELQGRYCLLIVRGYKYPGVQSLKGFCTDALPIQQESSYYTHLHLPTQAAENCS